AGSRCSPGLRAWRRRAVDPATGFAVWLWAGGAGGRPAGQGRRAADQVVETADQAQAEADQRAPRPNAEVPINPDADQYEARYGTDQPEAKAVGTGFYSRLFLLSRPRVWAPLPALAPPPPRLAARSVAT